MERRRELREIGKGGEPGETMASEKQPEGFEGAGQEGGGTRWWVLGRAQIAWSTGCGEKTMNTVTLKINKKFN